MDHPAERHPGQGQEEEPSSEMKDHGRKIAGEQGRALEQGPAGWLSFAKIHLIPHHPESPPHNSPTFIRKRKQSDGHLKYILK